MAVSTDDLRQAYMLGRGANNELTPEMLQKKGWANDRVMKVMNSLVEKRLCVLRKNKGTGKFWVKVREEDVAERVRTLPSDDYAVYCCIEDAGNVGIWTADMKRNTNLQQHLIQKAVKNLCEIKKLIKPLKSIHQKNRKIYMLANLEPAKEVVGGSFYDNGEFDSALVERLRDQISHILRNGTQSSLKDITNYIRTSGFGQDLSDADLKLVLKTLQLEQLVQASVNAGSGEVVYSWCRWPDEDLFAYMPCGVCQVVSECTRGGGTRVSPETCEYYDQWLGYQEPPAPPSS